eukprot:589316-Prymnesium_polylepis.1
MQARRNFGNRHLVVIAVAPDSRPFKYLDHLLSGSTSTPCGGSGGLKDVGQSVLAVGNRIYILFGSFVRNYPFEAAIIGPRERQVVRERRPSRVAARGPRTSRARRSRRLGRARSRRPRKSLRGRWFVTL